MHVLLALKQALRQGVRREREAESGWRRCGGYVCRAETHLMGVMQLIHHPPDQGWTSHRWLCASLQGSRLIGVCVWRMGARACASLCARWTRPYQWPSAAMACPPTSWLSPHTCTPQVGASDPPAAFSLSLLHLNVKDAHSQTPQAFTTPIWYQLFL